MHRAAERPEKLANCGFPLEIASQEVSEPRKAHGAEEIEGGYADWGCKGARAERLGKGMRGVAPGAVMLCG